MARTFSDTLTSELSSVFFNSDEFAVTVTITRGIASTTGVSAIVADRQYEAMIDDSIVTNVRVLDFDIVATAYQIDGQQASPRAGDRITTTADSVCYEVVPLMNKQTYEPTGGGGAVWRIHTRRIA